MWFLAHMPHATCKKPAYEASCWSNVGVRVARCGAGEMGDEAAPAGAVTKSGAKKAKAEAEKYYKRKADPGGQAKIEEGETFFKAGDFDKAKACFDAAVELCKSSSVERTARPKSEAPKEQKKEQDGPAANAISATKLLLVIVSPTRTISCISTGFPCSPPACE